MKKKKKEKEIQTSFDRETQCLLRGARKGKKRHSLWFNALGLQKHGVGTVIGFLSIAFENRLLKSLKRKSLQERIAQAV